MDPSGLIPVFICILLTCLLANALGMLVGLYRGDENHTELGFSNDIAAFSFFCAIPLGFSVYYMVQLFAKYNISYLYLVIFALAMAILIVLFSAIGLLNSKHREQKDFLVGFSKGLGAFFGAILTAPTRLIFKTMKLDASEDVTEKDVLDLVESLLENDDSAKAVNETQKDMITGIFELDDVFASDIMTHRTEVISVHENDLVCDVIDLASKEGISRLPVHTGKLDNVVGIVYVKDLLSLFNDISKLDSPIKEFMRTAMYVPETCRARELLLDFKTKHTQIAIVVDEYGGTSGIATMEDVLEEIVGSIQDEFDNEEEEMVACEEGILCDASIDLEDIFKALDLPMPELNPDEDEEFETISGLITLKLGRIPTESENAKVEWGNILFEVIESDHKQIIKVKASIIQ